MGSKINFCVALLFIFLDFFHFCNSTDTITSTQFISDAKDQTLLSSNGNFKLGFFSPNNSLNRYVGIWFNKVSKQTIVWVANRDSPLKDKNGIFKISGDGNIGVFAGKNGELPLWSSNVSMADTINSTAKLLDSGNFVLTRINGPGRVELVVWQSFDYPTDTALAGMKLGLDRSTGLNRVLSSWKAEDDPASGEFSFGIESRGPAQLFLYKMLAPYWRAGPWNGRTLSGLPIVASRKTPEFDFSDEIGLFNYSYVNSNDEIYLTFTVPNESIFSTLMLDPLGTVGRQIWRADTKEWIQFWATPQDKCDEYARCGPWAICNAYNTMQCTCLPGFEQEFPKDWYSKCAEKKRKVETCGKGNGEGFIRLTDLKVPDARTSRLYANLSLKECEMECLKSCNCSGYASANINVGGHGCFLWYGELVDVRVYVQAGEDFYLRVDASELAANMRKKGEGLKKTIKVIILPLLFGVLLFISCSCYLRRKQVKRTGLREKQKNREMLLLDSASNLSHIDSTNSNNREDSRNIELTFFDINAVITATKKFSPAKKIGEGGYGPVYKGELPNGQEIAVKRLSKNSGQGSIEFKNEALLIARLQHRNLVRLVGCCIENEEKMLIYEYMPNKSLDYFIFNENRKSSLDWKKRHEIIVGIARGMLYLHQDSRLRIIHRDLKASNILLDEELNPKISDFGTARIFGGNQNEANTNRVVGTFGYMSPEYALDGLFSVKSDVFSFGVLLLEIISGKKNTGFFQDDPSSNLIRNAWQLWSEDRALEIVDTSMGDSCPTHEVLRCIQVGLLCVQDNATDRPTMSSVVFMLSNETTLPSPKQPMFAIQRSHNNPDSTTTGTCSSINEVTVTMPDAR